MCIYAQEDRCMGRGPGASGSQDLEEAECPVKGMGQRPEELGKDVDQVPCLPSGCMAQRGRACSCRPTLAALGFFLVGSPLSCPWAQSPDEETAPCRTSVGPMGRLAPVPQQHSTSWPHKVQPHHQSVGPGAESHARELPTQLPPCEPAPEQQHLPWKVAGSEGPAPLLQVGSCGSWWAELSSSPDSY